MLCSTKSLSLRAFFVRFKRPLLLSASSSEISPRCTIVLRLIDQLTLSIGADQLNYLAKSIVNILLAILTRSVNHRPPIFRNAVIRQMRHERLRISERKVERNDPVF